jgi:hypothetical protein
MEGGPTHNSGIPELYEQTNPPQNGQNFSNIYERIYGNAFTTSSQITLPYDWQVGSTSHIQTQTVVWYAPESNDIVDGGLSAITSWAALRAGQKLVQALGGSLGIIGALYSISSATVSDTYYWIEDGPGNITPLVVSTPPIAYLSNPYCYVHSYGRNIG